MTDPSCHPSALTALLTFNRARRLRARLAAKVRRGKSERSAFYETVWREAAAELGAEVTAGSGETLEIRLSGRSTRVRNNCTPLDDAETLRRAGDKSLVYRLLGEAGLPVTRHLEFSLGTLHRALAFLQEAERDCVVKPAFGTGAGQGVTTGVRTPSQLAHAAAFAAAYGERLLIEEQVAGENYRLLYLEGRLLDAINRRAPSVTGDGRATVLELVRRENAARRERGWKVAQVPLTVDPDMRRTLADQGLELDSVPARGAVVRLKTVINENGGLENVGVRHLLCEEVIRAGARAAEAVGTNLAGVDVITTDPARPLEVTGGVVLEVNTTPGYYYHYHQSGEPFPAAVHVLRRLLEARDESPAGAPVLAGIA